MSKIVDWVKTLDEKKRQKPSKELQNNVNEKVIAALNTKWCNYSEAVEVITALSPQTIEEFYKNQYKKMSEDMQEKFDNAFFEWVKSRKLITQAFSRVVFAIRAKLPLFETCKPFREEVLWLAKNLDDKTEQQLSKLSEKSKLKEADLRKLLEIELPEKDWERKKVEHLLDYLFPERKENALDIAEGSVVIQPKEDQDNVENTISKEKELANNGLIVGDSLTPIKNGFEKKTEKSEVDSTKNNKESSTFIKNSSDGEHIKLQIECDGPAMAEALLKWTKKQMLRDVEQNKRIAELTLISEKQQVKIANLEKEICDLKESADTAEKIEKGLREDMESMKTDIKTLHEEKEKAENTIGQVQQMAGNSAKQELDGYKAKLSNALAQDIKDFYGDYKEDEKPLIYSAILESMIGTLKSNGIGSEGK